MLPQTVQEALTETILESLEKMAYVMAEPVRGPVDPPINPLCASVSFRGAQHGRVEIAASREFSLILAAHHMGVDSESECAVESADICLKELAQLVANTMAPHLADSMVQPVRLSTPTLRSLDVELDWPNLAVSRGTQLFNVEGHILAAHVVEVD